MSQSFNVPILNNPDPSGNPLTFGVALSSPNDATLGTPAIANIDIAEPTSSVQFASASYGATDGQGAVPITVTLSTPSSQTVTVNYATTTGGSAEPGVDYTPTSGTLTFQPGQTSQSFNVQVLDDTDPSGNPLTVNLALSSPGNATLGAQSTAVLDIAEQFTLQWQNGPDFTWTQTPPAPPVITNPGDQSNAEGDAVSLQVSATDPRGNALSYAAVNLPSGLSISPSTGLISGTVSYGDAEDFGGVYPVTVIVADSQGASSTVNFTWNISPTVLPPTLTNPGNQTNLRGDTVSLQIQGSQANGDQLVYDASNLPPGLSIDDQSGLISGTIDPEASALNTPYDVTVTATDQDQVASTSFTWTVSAANPAPVLTDPGDQVNAAGDSVDLALSATDQADNTLTCTATGLPPGLSIDPGAGVISGTLPNDAANANPYTVTVSASDGLATSSATFEWTVNVVGLQAPGDQNNVAGDVVSLPMTASDANGLPLTYSATGLPPGLSIDPDSGLISGTLPASAASANPYSVNVIASDGTNSATQSFTWSVAALALQDPGDQDNPEGTAVSLQLSATDVGGTPTYSATGLPAGLTLDPNTGLISGTIGTAAHGSSPYQAVVTATDGADSVNQSFVWTVTPQVALVNPGPQSNAAGDSVSLQVTAGDNSGGTLTYAATGLPDGLGIDPNTGVISGTLAADSASATPYTVMVSASDGAFSSTQAFPWSVSAINVETPPDQDNLDGDTVSLAVTTGYNGAGTLSYSATGLPPGLTIDPNTGLISGQVAATADTDSPYAVQVNVPTG
jgi:hypothetical protein